MCSPQYHNNNYVLFRIISLFVRLRHILHLNTEIINKYETENNFFNTFIYEWKIVTVLQNQMH